MRLKEKKRFIKQMYQIMWGRDAYRVEDIENNQQLTKKIRRLEIAKGHAWNQWTRESMYIHSLMENHPLNNEREVVLLLGDEKNQGEWRTKRELCLAQSKGGVVRG